MALRTTEDEDAKNNPGQADYEAKFGGLAKAESEGTVDPESLDINESGDIGEAEENGPWRNRVDSNYAGNKSDNTRGGLTRQNFVAIRKRKGAAAAIITLLLGGGIGVGFFSSFALLPVHVVENLFNKFDSQNTSMTLRTNKIITAKISNSATAGDCTITLLACRYTRPSNKLLNALDKNGIQALDKNGDVISKKFILANDRPHSYRFIDSNGKATTIDAKDFSKTLLTNDEFRGKFHSAYRPRFIGYADDIFKAVKNRFKITGTDKLSKSKTIKDVNDTINENVAGRDVGLKAGGEIANAADGPITEVITEEVEKETGKLAKSGKGDAAGLVGGAVCLVGDIPGIVIRTVRAYQMVQLVKYAAVFITAVGALKAGDASPEEISALATLLTAAYAGKTAMDSPGMKYALFGDTTFANNNYKKFSPGASVINTLGPVNQITNSLVKKSACSVVTNPATGIALDAATSETIVLPIINIVGGIAVSTLMQLLIEKTNIISTIVSAIPIDGILKFFVGDLTQNLSPEDIGNALPSGAAHMMGQTANAGGNVPLSVPQKLAYDNTTRDVQLAYAKEDRATLSPFDTSSPNTMLGSLVHQLLPYYSSMNSVAGIMSNVASIITHSFATLSGISSAYAATDDPSQYQLCDDPAIKDSNIAAGPFCNIEYGIPVKYLDRDPVAIVNELVASGDINEQSGEVIDKRANDPTGLADPGLKGWMDLCTDGSTIEASNCTITDTTDQKTVDYALYTMDHRIQKTMDGEDTTLDPSTTSAVVTDNSFATTLFGSSDTEAITSEPSVQYISNASSTSQSTYIPPVMASTSVSTLTLSSLNNFLNGLLSRSDVPRRLKVDV